MHDEGDRRSGGEHAAVWHEYPIGVSGEFAWAFMAVMFPLAIGVAATFVIILAVGIANDEHLVYELLSRVGFTFNEMSPFLDGLDQLLRMAVVPTLVVIIGGAALAMVALFVSDLSVSRGLVRAARGGASREEVPVPTQVESVVEERAWAMLVLLWVVVAAGALFGVIAVWVAVADGYVEGYGYGALFLVVGALGVGGLRVVKTQVRPLRYRRRLEIAAHWTTADETRAWECARGAEAARREPVEATSGGSGRDRRVKIGRRITGWASRFFSLAIVTALGVVYLWYPQGNRFTGAGPRAEWPVPVEAASSGALIGAVAVMIVCALGIVVGHLVEGVGRRAERSRLRRAASDGARPPEALIVEYSERAAVKLASALAEVSGVLLVFGPAMLILARTDNDVYRGADELFGRFSVPALVGTLAGVALLLIAAIWNAVVAWRGADLRNLLVATWPILPTDTTESDGDETRLIPARVGPALTPGSGRNDIVS